MVVLFTLDMYGEIGRVLSVETLDITPVADELGYKSESVLDGNLLVVGHELGLHG